VSLNAFEKQYKGENVALSMLLNFGGKKGKQFSLGILFCLVYFETFLSENDKTFYDASEQFN